jgi:hypothetical protein
MMTECLRGGLSGGAAEAEAAAEAQDPAAEAQDPAPDPEAAADCADDTDEADT